MDQEQFHGQLDALKSELEASEGLADGTRDKLLVLVSRMEEQLHGAEDEPESIPEQFEALKVEFETSHPTLTGIVNNILVTLSNMGV